MIRQPDPLPLLPCPRCERGWLHQPEDHNGPGEDRECPECDGTGEVVDLDAEDARIDSWAAAGLFTTVEEVVTWSTL
jgi:hypothetical protein